MFDKFKVMKLFPYVFLQMYSFNSFISLWFILAHFIYIKSYKLCFLWLWISSFPRTNDKKISHFPVNGLHSCWNQWTITRIHFCPLCFTSLVSAHSSISMIMFWCFKFIPNFETRTYDSLNFVVLSRLLWLFEVPKTQIWQNFLCL